MATKYKNGNKKKKREAEALDAEEIIESLLEEEEEAPAVMGRPKSIKSPEEMEERIIAYLSGIPRWGLPTKAGLTFALGVTRDTLNRYEKDDDFSDILKHWYPYFEDCWVQNLSRPNATGTIFYLKNTYQYRDTVDVSPNGLTINFVLPQEISGKYAQQIEAPKPVEAVVIPEAVVEPHEVPPSTITSSE